MLSSCNNEKKGKQIVLNSIEFLDTIHHFGVIPLSNPIDSVDFKFINRGSNLLVILNAKPSCRCTKVKYPKYPISSGDTSYVRVIYDGTGRNPEYFNKSVEIYTNASSSLLKLNINGQLK